MFQKTQSVQAYRKWLCPKTDIHTYTLINVERVYMNEKEHEIAIGMWHEGG